MIKDKITFKTPVDLDLKTLYRSKPLKAVRRLGFTSEWSEYIFPCADQTTPVITPTLIKHSR